MLENNDSCPIADSNKMILNDIIINSPKIKLMGNEEFVSKLTNYCMRKSKDLTRNDTLKMMPYKDLLAYGINLKKESSGEDDMIMKKPVTKLSNKRIKAFSGGKLAPFLNRKNYIISSHITTGQQEDNAVDTYSCLGDKRPIFTKKSNNTLMSTRIMHSFNNICDSFESENEEIEYVYFDYLPKIYSIHPQSTLSSMIKEFLEFLHFVIVVYYSTTLITNLNRKVLEVILEIGLIFKFVTKHFLIGFSDPKMNKINFSPYKIFIRAMTIHPVKSIFDLLNALPVKIVILIFGIDLIWQLEYAYVFLKILLISSMSSYLDISSLFNSWHSDEQLDNSNKIKQGFSSLHQFFTRPELKILVLFLLCLHLYSCFWIFSAKRSSSSTIYNENSWIVANHYDVLELQSLYVVSIYFSMTTLFTIGYGDIVARTTLERVIVIAFLVFGCLIYTFFISITSNLMTKHNQKQQMLAERVEYLKSIKCQYKLTQNFIRKIEEQMRFYIKNWHGDKEELLKSLPHSLKVALQTIIYSKYFGKVKFLKLINNHSFLVNLSSKVKIFHYDNKEVVLQQSQILDEMLFVISGSITLSTKIGYESCPIARITEGNHFGSILVYTYSLSPYTIVADKKSTVMFLSKKDLSALKLEYTGIVGGLLKESYISHFFTEIKRKMAEQYFHDYFTLINFSEFYMQKVNEAIMKDMEANDLQSVNQLNELTPKSNEPQFVAEKRPIQATTGKPTSKSLTKQQNHDLKTVYTNLKVKKVYLEDSILLSYSHINDCFYKSKYITTDEEPKEFSSVRSSDDKLFRGPAHSIILQGLIKDARDNAKVENNGILSFVKKRPIPKVLARTMQCYQSQGTYLKVCTQFSFTILKQQPNRNTESKTTISSLTINSNLGTLKVPKVRGLHKTCLLKKIDLLIARSSQSLTSPFMESRIQSLVKRRKKKKQ